MSLFFLMCSERSGSNFITKLLNGHSNLCGPSTKHIINPVARNLFRYEPIGKEENWKLLLEDMHELMSVGFSIWKKQFSLEDLMSIAPIGNVQALIRNIFLEEAKENGKQHVFIKENHVYEFLPFLLLNFPESKYVYQVRDPRDMALSWKKNNDHPGGVAKAARQWKKDQQAYLKNHNELKKRDKSIFIRYEDLISEPKISIQQIIKHLGLKYEDSIFDYYKDELTQKNSKKQKAWNNLSKEILSDNKEKYRKELTDYEIKIIEKICYFEMKATGYNTENSLDSLDIITESELDNMEELENNNIKTVRSEGVIANMEAKKRFYQQLI